MLEMQNVTKTFGDFTALKNLSLTVPKGAVYGLVGPNGAGKSTAIRHLTGIYRQDSGSILRHSLSPSPYSILTSLSGSIFLI